MYGNDDIYGAIGLNVLLHYNKIIALFSNLFVSLI